MEYNEVGRIVEGYGNVSIIDNQGDFVPVSRMVELMPIYMKRGGILMDSHTNRHIGNIMHWELRDKDGKDAIYLWAKIFNDYSIDNMVWKAIGNKHYTGFSFGGRSIDKDIKCDEGVCFNNIKDLEVWEWSIVPKPANKESTFTKFNEIAKGDRMSTVLVPRMEDGEIVYDTAEMPMDDGMLNKGEIINQPDKGQYEKMRDLIPEYERKRLSTRTEDETEQRRLDREEAGTDTEKMDDYQPPGIQEEEKMSDEHTEIEKAGSQSRGPRQTSAKEYSDVDIEDIAGKLSESERGHQKPQRGVNQRHTLPKKSEALAQVYGSKHGLGYHDMAGDDLRSGEGKRVSEKAKRIYERRPNEETEKMDDTQEVAKEDTPMTAPAEDAGNPMNKIISILESIENRLTDLEGGAPEVEEKAELEDTPMEEEKAETPKKVTVPEPQKQQEDKILNKGEETPERLSDIVGELKKMGYDKVTTPKPAVNSEFPLSGGQTVGDLLNKSDTGVVDIHKQLGDMSFKEIDGMFKGE